jgi:hypothetical protein
VALLQVYLPDGVRGHAAAARVVPEAERGRGGASFCDAVD